MTSHFPQRSANDKVTSYTYDAVGNQTSMKYPDNTVVNYVYDLLGRQIKVTDAEQQATTYKYDSASQLIEQIYPNGWKEFYQYDAIGQLTKVLDINPRGWLTSKEKSWYTYDANGNLTKEYVRGTGTGQKTEEWTYKYDALNRLTQTDGRYCRDTTKFTYDSLGNLTYEMLSSSNYTDYKYNKLNQLTEKTEKTSILSSDQFYYEYDKRGNLVKELEKVSSLLGSKNKVVSAYIYDATNRMVLGANESGETSAYIYNGLGYRVGNVEVSLKDCYGYYGFGSISSSWFPWFNFGSSVGDSGLGGISWWNWWWKPGSSGNSDKPSWPFSGITQPSKSKTQTIEKSYVLDYTSELKDVIMEEENCGLTYRITYGLDKLSSVMSGPIHGTSSLCINGKTKVWYHQDRLGSTDIVTDNVKGNVISHITYNAWGEATQKQWFTLGKRQLDLSAEYTGHPYDEVLSVYFAEARMYDASDRRFMAMDWVKGNVLSLKSLNRYLYAVGNPIKWIDLYGLEIVIATGGAYSASSGYNYEFIDSALLQIKTIRRTSDETIMMLVADAGWSTTQKADIEEAVLKFDNIEILFFDDIDSLVNPINNGSSNNRQKNLITDFYVFSHGLPGKIPFGYNHGNYDDLAFTVDHIKLLDKAAFTGNAYFHLYTCRAASTVDGATNFAQALADWTLAKVIAPYSGKGTAGRTDYSNILGFTTKDYIFEVLRDMSVDNVAEAALATAQASDYEEERKSAVGGISKPYPALRLPRLATNIFTERNPHWVTFSPSIQNLPIGDTIPNRHL